LAITTSYITNAPERLKTRVKIKIKDAPGMKCTLTIFEEHGLMAHIP